MGKFKPIFDKDTFMNDTRDLNGNEENQAVAEKQAITEEPPTDNFAEKLKPLASAEAEELSEATAEPDVDTEETNNIKQSIEETKQTSKTKVDDNVKATAEEINIKGYKDYIPIEDIELNPDNYIFSDEDTEEEINDLAENIRINGLLSDLVLNEVEDNRYIVLSGERRLKAIKKLGTMTKIPSLVFTNLDNYRAMLIMASANLAVREVKSSKKYQQFLKMQEIIQGAAEDEALAGIDFAKILGITERQVRRYKRLSQTLTEQENENIAAGKTSISSAEKIITSTPQIVTDDFVTEENNIDETTLTNDKNVIQEATDYENDSNTINNINEEIDEETDEENVIDEENVEEESNSSFDNEKTDKLSTSQENLEAIPPADNNVPYKETPPVKPITKVVKEDYIYTAMCQGEKREGNIVVVNGEKYIVDNNRAKIIEKNGYQFYQSLAFKID